MTSTEIMPPPDVKAILNSPTKLAREKAAFGRLLPNFLEKYRTKYVAVHEERVVGSGDDLVTVALAAYAEFGYQPIYVDLVTDEPVPLVFKQARSKSAIFGKRWLRTSRRSLRP